MNEDGALKTVVRAVLPLSLRKALYPLREIVWRSRCELGRWFCKVLPDRCVQERQFQQRFGRPLNLESPATFNEKIHWLMLNYRIPVMTQLADKCKVRGYVAARVGDSLLNDLYGVWDDPWAVEFERLPDSFVLKVTSGSGQNVLCRDKAKLNVERTRLQLAEWMKRNEYWVSREWAYKRITPRIIGERFLKDEQGNVPSDYKLFCFNGEPLFVQVDTDRFTDHRRDLFDLDWKLLPFNIMYSSSQRAIPRPANLETMISAARALSQGFPFVRVDLYSTGERMIFGEMTWYPEGGLSAFIPDSYDLEWGNVLRLPSPMGASLFERVWSSMVRISRG